MNLEHRLRESLVAPDPGAVFTARVMARMTRGRARKGRRFMVIGAVLVAGIAAAMLMWQESGLRPTTDPNLATAIPESSDTAPAVEQVTPPPPVALEPSAALTIPELPPAASPHYSVLVMPLRHEIQDAAGRSLVEAFYSSMVEELRKVPGLVLQTAGSSADHVLTISSLATSFTSSGNLRVSSTDGRTTLVQAGSLSGMDQEYGINPLTGKQEPGEIRSIDARDSLAPGSIWIEMKVESRGAPLAWYTLGVGVAGASKQGQCSSSVARSQTECMSPTQLAARQIEKLRLQLFPPDAALQRRLVARLGNASLTQEEQFQVLTDLLMLPDVTGSQPNSGSRLDDGTLRALASYAPALPAPVRANIWSMLRRFSNPALVSPLVESLRRDSDRQVRLEALATLTANFAADPVVRAALESVAQKETDQAVRIAVRRELYGPAQWRNDVVAALNNADLTYENMLAPLQAGRFSTLGDVRALLQDRQVLLKVVDVVREHLDDAEHVRVTREALVLLSNAKDPVVSELFAEARSKGLQTPFGSGTLTMVDGVITGGEQNGYSVNLPSTLLERMQEITQQAKPAGQ